MSRRLREAWPVLYSRRTRGSSPCEPGVLPPLSQKPASLCVYCGASDAVPQHFFAMAEALGRLLGEAEIRMVYGGGTIGMMRSVAEGVAAAGGQVLGIIPEYLRSREATGPFTYGELVVVETMHERKRLMADNADGFIVLPGGFGTLDELFEILTWRQLGLHDKPIVLANIDGYWTPLIELLDRMTAHGFVSPTARHLIHAVDRIEDILPVFTGAAATRLMLAGDLV